MKKPQKKIMEKNHEKLNKFTFGKNPFYIFLPFTLIVLIILGLYAGLSRPERGLPSPHIGKKIPAFQMETLQGEPINNHDLITDEDVSIVNFFASWCVPCLAEHPLLQDLTTRYNIPIYGVAWNDNRQNIQNWLNKHGNVFKTVIMDNKQDLGLELGVYGIPETFIIDKKGIIRYRWAGVLTEELIKDEILPTLTQYRQ